MNEIATTSASRGNTPPAPLNPPQPGLASTPTDNTAPTASDAGTAKDPHFPQANGESDRAFEAFRVYLELGPKRRYAVVGKKVGTCLRTIQRWANDFDWRGRINTYSAQCAEQYAEIESAEIFDTAARSKAFRDRQYAAAETLLDAVERYLERVDGDDLDVMSFSDACKALGVVSRLAEQAAPQVSAEAAAAPSNALRDQIESLLDQAYSEVSSQNGKGQTPSPSTPNTR